MGAIKRYIRELTEADRESGRDVIVKFSQSKMIAKGWRMLVRKDGAEVLLHPHVMPCPRLPVSDGMGNGIYRGKIAKNEKM